MPRKTKEARAEYMREWKTKNPEKVKVWNKKYRGANIAKKYPINQSSVVKCRLRKYGISIDDFNEMFALQNGKCAICGKHQTEFKKILHIDHCHETNKFRGLLCSNCNTAIGLLKDDIENLRCAILYLNRKE